MVAMWQLKIMCFVKYHAEGGGWRGEANGEGRGGEEGELWEGL